MKPWHKLGNWYKGYSSDLEPPEPYDPDGFSLPLLVLILAVIVLFLAVLIGAVAYTSAKCANSNTPLGYYRAQMIKACILRRVDPDVCTSIAQAIRRF